MMSLEAMIAMMLTMKVDRSITKITLNELIPSQGEKAEEEVRSKAEKEAKLQAEEEAHEKSEKEVR